MDNQYAEQRIQIRLLCRNFINDFRQRSFEIRKSIRRWRDTREHFATFERFTIIPFAVITSSNIHENI